MVVNAKTNEVVVADGYQNRRVVVFDADTGAYKRHWGAYGNKPDDAAPRTHVLPDGPGPPQFTYVHGIAMSRDGRIYVADRWGNRVQVFTPEGKFLQEVFVARRTPSAVADVSLSLDARQQFLYVADGASNKMWILDRDSLAILGSFGRLGRNSGQFHTLHNVAVDSKGSLYTGEALVGRRVQKFVMKGMKPLSSQ